MSWDTCRLRVRFAKEGPVGNHSAAQAVSGGWGKWAALAVVATLGVATVTAVAGASSPTPSVITNLTFTPLTAGHKVFSGTVAAHKTASPVVSGGSTTVPYSATTIRFTVTAKGSAGGVLDFYPAGNTNGGSGQTLTYASGNVMATGQIEEKVGQSNELTIVNSGTGSAAVTLTATAYSTQVTTDDVSSTGGSFGQVLTNQGSGVAWGPAGGAVYISNPQSGAIPVNTTLKTVASVTVPAGTYLLLGMGTVINSGAQSDLVECFLVSTTGTSMNEARATIPGLQVNTNETQLASQGVAVTGGGTFLFRCRTIFSSSFSIFETTLSALEVSSSQGNVQLARPRS